MSKAAAAPEATEANTADMIDPNAGMVDLDREGRNGELPEGAIDEARAAIYARHAEKRQEELAVQAETPDDEVTVKVNGKERKVARAKIDAAGGVDAYQKNAAASEILNQATAQARQVKEQAEANERRRQELDAREQQLSRGPQQQAEPTTRLPADAGALKTLARKYHDAMLDGDIDQADELLLQINAAQTATAVNSDEIATRAVQRAREELTAEEREKQAKRFEAERLEAVTDFSKKHKDLASNPDAHGLVDAKTNEIYREHPDWGPKAIIEEAANRVRAMIRSVATPTSTADKLDAKRNSTQIRAGSARSAPRPAQRPQTNSEYVATIRAARGLPT